MEPIYRILDSGIFVLFVILIYFVTMLVGRRTMHAVGSGSLYTMLRWITWGLGFGMVFQAYIFTFDYKHVGGFSVADVSVGWHFFFVMTIVFMLLGMVQVLRK